MKNYFTKQGTITAKMTQKRNNLIIGNNIKVMKLKIECRCQCGYAAIWNSAV